jgi:uncharacterized membrane protein
MSEQVCNSGSKMFNKLFAANKKRVDLDQNLGVKKNHTLRVEITVVSVKITLILDKITLCV